MKESDPNNQNNDLYLINNYSDYEQEAKIIRESINPKENNIQPLNIINNEVSSQNQEERELKIQDLKKKTNDAINITTKRKSGQSFIKSLVSQDKNRFCFDGFDLDLTYITSRIIAMGLPSTSYEALYRNNMTDVLNFFNSIFLILDILNIIKFIIYVRKKNMHRIYFINKGILYLNYFDTAADCLKYYGIMRVDNGRGVTVPSQIRYVFYFEQILKNNIPHPIYFKQLKIKKIRMVTIPSFNKISFEVENTVDKKTNVFNYKKKETLDENAGYVDFELGEDGFIVCGDVKILFFTFTMFGGKDKIFKLWFNTNFVPQDDVLEIKKDLIDKACKDKHCKKFNHNFKIEVHMIDVDI